MKTSNKILLGFFMLVFAAPILLLMGFRNKIKNGEFSVTRLDANSSNIHKGVITPYKVVKIIGPGIAEVFSCNIFPAGTGSYEYINYNNSDSVSVQQKGDTLLVTYVNMSSQVNANYQEYTHLSINLYLPGINHIIMEGASVVIDSMSAMVDTAVYFHLSKQANLTLGEYGSSTTVKTALVENTDSNMPDTILSTSLSTEKSTGQFNKINISATNSYVNFGMHAWMKNLNVNMLGWSTIAVDDKSRIEQLAGYISDSATVKANWKNIRRLATLTGK
ncbi:MAG: hypothetical protein ABJB11_24655 [Ferruginibacter sp.]